MHSKLKTERQYDPAIPLEGICPKETKSQCQRDICTPMFTTALFTIAKTWKQPNCPLTDEQINKMWCIYIYTMEYFSAIKKDILPFATTWMTYNGHYAK